MNLADDSLQPDSQSTTCRCGAVVRFDASDRGQTVYCPSCGTGVPIPYDVPPPPERDEASVPLAPQRATRGGIFGDPATLADREVDRILCLCGQSIPVTLADFDGTVYCPSCSAEVPVARRLTRFRPPEQTVEEPPAVSPVLKPNASRFSLPMISLFGLLAVALGFGALNSWHERAEIATALRKTLFRQASQVSDPHGPFELESVTPDAIEDLKTHPHPFQALTLALTWQREMTAADPGRQDARHDRLARTIDHILRNRVDVMRTMIEEAVNAVDLEAAREQLTDWRGTLITAGMPEEAETIVHLDDAQARIDARLHPITLEQIEQLLEGPPEEALVQALMWDETLHRRSVAPDDPRRERLAGVLTELRRRLHPPSTETDSVGDRLQRLLSSLAGEIEAGRFETARESAEAARRLIDGSQEELAIYEPRLQLLEERIALYEEAGRRAVEFLGMLTEAQRLASTQETTDAILLEAQVRFRARQAPSTRATADRMRRRIHDLAGDIRRSRGIRAATDARLLDEQGDRARRNQEARRAFELLAEFPDDDEVHTAFEIIEPWKDEALANAGSPASVPAASEYGRTLLLRDHLEEALELYARGDSEALETVALTLHRRLQSRESPLHSYDEFLGDCLLEVLESDVRSELAGGQLSSDAGDRFQTRLQALSDWNSLPRWTTIESLINP